MSPDFWAGYISGAAGILVGNPLDIVKVRLQAGKVIASSLGHGSHPVRATRSSLLLVGTPGPLLGYGALNALLFVAYNRSEDALNRLLSGSLSSAASGTGSNLWGTWLAGAAGGLATWVISTPTELVKCSAQLASAAPPSPASSSYSIARTILRTDGVCGLYQGGVVTALRDSIGYGFYFWSYELSKRMMGPLVTTVRPSSPQSQETVKTLLCGGIAGVITWASIFPLDVVKTRLQGQILQGSPERKRGAIEIAGEAYREGGTRVFFRGLGVCSLRAFVVNSVQWALYEWTMARLRRE